MMEGILLPQILPLGESDFLCEVKNRDPDAVWEIIDDLMDTLHTVNPRVYEGVMRKIRSC